MRVNMQPLFKTAATKGPVGLKMRQRGGRGSRSGVRPGIRGALALESVRQGERRHLQPSRQQYTVL